MRHTASMTTMQQYSIGAVSRITQIPAHTLRKWESRHGIAVPTRTDTGRRVYTQADIEHLQLIKSLMESGHALRHLADLSTEELSELGDQSQGQSQPVIAEQVSLIGPQVSRLLGNQEAVVMRDDRVLKDWLAASSAVPSGTVVAETATVTRSLLETLTTLAAATTKLVVVYQLGSRSAIEQLRLNGIVALPAPVQDSDLLNVLSTRPAQERAASVQRFSSNELNRIANLNPGLQCECPNHIARLLIDISAFEQYSNECEDDDPAEAALHHRLARISAEARSLFEDALLAVASADGLQIETRP